MTKAVGVGLIRTGCFSVYHCMQEGCQCQAFCMTLHENSAEGGFHIEEKSGMKCCVSIPHSVHS